MFQDGYTIEGDLKPLTLLIIYVVLVSMQPDRVTKNEKEFHKLKLTCKATKIDMEGLVIAILNIGLYFRY